MQSICLVLVLMCASYATALFCKLEDASDEPLNVSTDHTVWYEQYRYPYPLMALELAGCLTMNVNPGEGPGDMVLDGSFSRSKLTKLTGKAHMTGNRMDAKYDGIFGAVVSGPRNVMATDNKTYLIDHFCMLGGEISTIFTNEKNPSEEKMNEIWKVVAAHPILSRARYNHVGC